MECQGLAKFDAIKKAGPVRGQPFEAVKPQIAYKLYAFTDAVNMRLTFHHHESGRHP